MKQTSAREARIGVARNVAAAFVTRRTGHRVPFSTLQYWEDCGLLPAKTPGRRRPSNYTVPDLVRACIVAELRRGGVSLQAVRAAVGHLKRLLPGIVDAPGAWRLAVLGNGDVVRVVSDSQLLSLLKRPGQTAAALLLIEAGAHADAARAAVFASTLTRRVGAA